MDGTATRQSRPGIYNADNCSPFRLWSQTLVVSAKKLSTGVWPSDFLTPCNKALEPKFMR